MRTYTQPDGAVTEEGMPVHIPVLANDGLLANVPASVCVTPQAPPPAGDGAAIRFVDVAGVAGVTGAPQKIIRTSPHCLFDQYDHGRLVWDRGTLCLPEILTGGAAAGDFDGDGRDDIYFTRMDGMDSLYRNVGNGSFEDVAADVGLAMTADTHSNGVVLVDVDNDGDLDIYVSTLGDKRFYLFINDGTGHFTEQAVARGVDLTRPLVSPGEGGLTSAFSVAVGDYDGDGWVDLYTTEWFPRLDLNPEFRKRGVGDRMAAARLLRNLGASGKPGHFEDMTMPAGLFIKVGGGGADGHNMNFWWSAGHQTDVFNYYVDAGLSPEEAKARVLSLNREATRMHDLEMSRADMINALRQSMMKGADESGRVPHSPVHFMGFPHMGCFEFGARFTDFDGDGAPDLLISGDFGTTQLYWNNGNGTFRRGYLHPLWDLSDNSMGQTVGDVNGDGRLDVLFTSMALKLPSRLALDRFFPNAGIAASFEGNHLYMNEGKHLFVDVTDHAGVREGGWAWGGVLFDYDNDGWLDITVANGLDDPETTDDDFAVNTPNVAYHNSGPKGNFVFTPVAADLGLDDRRDGRGYFEFDYDNDGDLDLFLVNHADAPALYRNDGGNQYASLRLRVREAACAGEGAGGPPAGAGVAGEMAVPGCRPRDSLGARVYLQAAPGAKEFMREVGSAAAYMAHSELVAHFGLGPALRRTTVHRVRIVWPTRNASVVLYDVPIRSTVDVRAPARRGEVQHLRFASEAAAVSAPVSEAEGAAAMPVLPCTAFQLRVVGVTPPAHGTATVGAAGAYVTYTPDADYVGDDAFEYDVAPASVVASGDAAAIAAASRRESVVVRVQGGAAHAPDAAAGVSLVEAAVLPAWSGAGNHATQPFAYGLPRTPFIRLTLPAYSDAAGVGFPRPPAVPSARLVSNVLMHQHAPLPSSAGVNDLFVALGLWVAHDLEWGWAMGHLRTPEPGAPATDSIAVPPYDAQWDAGGSGGVVMPYSRAPHRTAISTSGATTQRRVRQMVNGVTHFLDLHGLYGMSDERSASLRTRATTPGGERGATLRSQARDGGGRGVLRTLLPYAGAGTGMVNPWNKAPTTLFEAGDDRANMLPGLIALHTVFMREHNRLVEAVTTSPVMHRHVLDTMSELPVRLEPAEAVFRAAAAVVRAQYQAMVWYEYLPALVGTAAAAAIPPYTGYDASVDPSVSVEFATAAAQYWVSMLGDAVARPAALGGASATGGSAGSAPLPLRDAWFAPHRIVFEGGVEPVLRGALSTVAQAADLLVVEGARNGFLGGAAVGLDLAAIMVQRGRDAGVPSFGAVRAALGLPNVTASWADLVATGRLPAKTGARVAARLAEVYGRPDDVDLLVGGLLEAPAVGSDGVLGATLARLTVEQFVRTRAGDRFWFENPASPLAGVYDTLGGGMAALRGTRMAAVLERTTGIAVGGDGRGALYAQAAPAA